MAKRISQGVDRGPPLTIVVDGVPIQAYPGETIAATLMAAGRLTLSFNWNDRARGPVCNMGVCFECLVEMRRSGDAGAKDFELQRACMTPVEDGMTVRTAGRGRKAT